MVSIGVADPDLRRCPNCGSKDLSPCAEVEEHTQEDIVLPVPQVTLYRKQVYWCKNCSKKMTPFSSGPSVCGDFFRRPEPTTTPTTTKRFPGSNCRRSLDVSSENSSDSLESFAGLLPQPLKNFHSKT
jgi:hypothetical protein